MLREKIRISLFMSKYIILLIALIMLIHVLCLDFGYRGEVAENLLVLGFGLTLFFNDITFGFCWFHRMCIVYAIAMDWCINFEYNVGFGEWLIPMRVVMTVWGVTMLIIFFKGKHLYGRAREFGADVRACWKGTPRPQKRLEDELPLFRGTNCRYCPNYASLDKSCATNCKHISISETLGKDHQDHRELGSGRCTCTRLHGGRGDGNEMVLR